MCFSVLSHFQPWPLVYLNYMQLAELYGTNDSQLATKFSLIFPRSLAQIQLHYLFPCFQMTVVLTPPSRRVVVSESIIAVLLFRTRVFFLNYGK